MIQQEYVQYGCGFSAPSDWRNFDASPTLRFERLPVIGMLYSRNAQRFPPNVEYGDIIKGLPVPPMSCKAVYCSHVLEHLSLEDFRTALINTFDILINGGVFRLVVPDLEYFASEYLKGEDSNAAMDFLENSCLGRRRRARGLKAMFLDHYGNSRHQWMWDYKSISKELEKVGFSGIRRARFGDSNEKMFKSVEDEGRWMNCLGVECMRK